MPIDHHNITVYHSISRSNKNPPGLPGLLPLADLPAVQNRRAGHPAEGTAELGAGLGPFRRPRGAPKVRGSSGDVERPGAPADGMRNRGFGC